MPSSNRHRLCDQIARNAAWSSFAWLAVLVGCVDAPHENFTPVETSSTTTTPTASGELVQADLTETVTSPAGPINSLVAAVETEPSPIDPEPATEEPQPTLASEDEGAQSTPGLFPVPEPDTGVEENAAGSVEGQPTVPTPVGEQPVPTPAETDKPTPSGSPDNAAPRPLSELPPKGPSPEPTIAETESAESSPVVPAPFPGAEKPAATLKPDPEKEPRPEPAAPLPNEPAATEKSAVLDEPVSTAPAPVPQAGEPALNANANPLESAKPKGYIHINPKQRTPENGAIPNGTENENITGKLAPAVVLPPSSAADAAVLAPLPQKNSSEQRPADPQPPTKPKGIPVSPVSIRATESDEPPATEIPEGFIPLLNSQNMTGWEVIDGKADSWDFKDGVVSCVAPGGGWIQTLAMYSDFELRFEYRLSPGGNSGISLRYPGQGNPSLEGLEIQLIDDQAEKYKNIQPEQATGSLYFAAAPQVRDAALPAGNWNHCVVKCVGQRLDVTINDKLVNEIDLTQISTQVEGVARTVAAIRSPMGAIALQSHSTRVDFRQIVLRDMTQVLSSGVRWLELQEGTGEAVPPGAKVTVHYIAHLSTGKRFANSIEKDKPATVELRDVIPGWREGIPGMKVGGKRRLVVPPAMAYGEKGFKEVVPPNSTLVYEIELLEFQPAEDEVPLEAADASPTDIEVK